MNPGPVIVKGVRLGNVVHVADGYVFVPAVAGRKSSRKVFATAKACLPPWVKRALRKAVPA